ncbi:hypothetical protein TrVE_jg5691 [Triparma verrucosa]|uniref:dolichyl-P-Man:Man5GlcNAc2-PP-dolichol alpha-1,3-mannosyltransferase n=1 Tax=Triparma verrucosa TaxID=1606542 RepID=A0A9W7F9D5_9STRA|nr:hypothetical protein TrVE_jg5691 [Triparma verrucosa]
MITQYIFLIIYVCNRAVTFRVYYIVFGRSWKFYVSIILLCLSKRIHSLYLLRLFNDCLQNLFTNLSLLLFLSDNSYALASLIYSVGGVGIKMNALLYSPGILITYVYKRSFERGRKNFTGWMWEGRWGFFWLGVCAGGQVLVGWPFLRSFPESYLRKAFELDRVFFFKWTVNFRFLGESLFVSKTWGKFLLLLHVLTLAIMSKKWTSQHKLKRSKDSKFVKVNPGFIALVCYGSNFIGILYARTMHYQFYSWYHDSLPLLIWSTVSDKGFKGIKKGILLLGIIMGGIEYAFNVYPSTSFSSAVLQAVHFFLMWRLWKVEGVPEGENGEKGYEREGKKWGKGSGEKMKKKIK